MIKRLFLPQRLLSLALAFGVLLGLVTAVFAHDVVLLISEPTNGSINAVAPAQLTAVFNEEMRTEDSYIKVYDANGTQVDMGDGGVNLEDPLHASMVVTLPELPAGAYLVRWRVVLLDTDPTEGQFNFFVGTEDDAAAANFQPIAPDEMITFSTEDIEPSDLPTTTLILIGVIITLFLAGGIALFALRQPQTT